MTGAAPPMRPAPRVRRRVFAVASLLAAIVSTYGTGWLTDRMIWRREGGGLPTFYVLRLSLLALAAVAFACSFAMVVGSVRLSRRVRRVAIAGLASAIVGLSLEALFMFVAQSHNVGYTLAQRVWLHRYWGPPNALGYRDCEHVRVAGKKLVFALGDSFTAGAGVRQEERFADELARLRPDLQVMNLGQSGDDSPGEFARLRAHPLLPDIVVLQYYPNDIEGAAKRAGHEMPPFTPYADVTLGSLHWLVRNSFLANFAYWQFAHGDGDADLKFLMHMERDPEVSHLHLMDLAAICTWAGEHRVKLVVVLLPLLEDLAWSRAANRDVKELFVSHGVTVLDIADRIEDLSVGERTVNHHDGHASPIVHARIAAALAEVLER